MESENGGYCSYKQRVVTEKISKTQVSCISMLSFRHFLTYRYLYASCSALTPPKLGARWPKWLEREFTNRKVRGSNPPSATRLPLSRLRQPGSIPALVLPSGGMAGRHRKGATAERFTPPKLIRQS
ncbi:hypothetical protein T265_14508, partial [Opisthorchis viverrini]